MGTRQMVAFVAGAAAFALAPPFDAAIPGDRIAPAVPWPALGWAAAVGAAVVLIAGERRAWPLAAAGAVVGALLSLVHVTAPGPPPLYPADFGWAYAASGVLYFFAFTAPPAALGGLAAGLALDLAAVLRRRR